MPTNRLAYTKTPASLPASGGVAYKANSYNCSNATSKVVSLNGTWKTDSISFTVDPLYRYTVHVRNSASIGATSINIDFIEVYGEASASYLTCSEDSGGYRFGFGSHEKIDEVNGSGNTVDMGDRWLDVRLGRTFKPDVKAAKYPHISPYVYAANNPIYFIDPDGKDIIVNYVPGKDGKGGTLNITVNAKIIDLRTNSHPADAVALKSDLVAQANKYLDGLYNTGFDDIGSVKVDFTLNLSVVNSLNDIGANDHVIALVDDIGKRQSDNKNKEEVDAIGLARIDGNVMAVEKSIRGQVSFHELLHSLGLGHSDDKDAIMYKSENEQSAMRRGKFTTSEKKEIFNRYLNNPNKTMKYRNANRDDLNSNDSKTELKDFLKGMKYSETKLKK